MNAQSLVPISVKAEAPSEMAVKAVTFLKSNPAMRAKFIDMVSGHSMRLSWRCAKTALINKYTTNGSEVRTDLALQAILHSWPSSFPEGKALRKLIVLAPQTHV